MIRLLLIVFLILFTTNVFGQSKVLTHFNENVYSFISYTESGEIDQQGYFYKIGDDYLPHGKWVHRNGQTATFEMGNMKTLTLQNGKTLTEEELRLIPLIPKLKQVEQKLITKNI